MAEIITSPLPIRSQPLITISLIISLLKPFTSLAMSTQVVSSQSPIEQLVEEILMSRKITRNHQQQLMTFFSDPSIDSQAWSLIQRVQEALQRGLLRVVD